MKESQVWKSEQARRTVLAAYEEVLRSWPLPIDRLTLGTKAGETRVLAFGQPGDSPLVLLHGAGSNSSMWRGEALGLAQGRRVYAVDLIGEPGFSAETRLPTADLGMAEWLGELLAALASTEGWGGKRPLILGLSLGGWLALAYAIRFPEAVAGLVLLCPSGLSRPRRGFLAKAIMAGFRGRAGLRMLSASLYGDFPPLAEALDFGVRLSECTKPRLGEIYRFTDGELGGLSIPVYLAVGDKDVMLDSRASAERLSALCREAKIETVAGGGHVFLGHCSPLPEMIEALGP
jgi:pimeloyl-ACP methyl ester carboxylesterase